MFGIFKRKKKQPGISEIIGQALAQGENGLHVNLYVDDQILFQVVPAKHYAKKGVEGEDAENDPGVSLLCGRDALHGA